MTSDSFQDLIQVGNVEVMERCLQNGGVFNDRSFLFAAILKNRKIEVLEWLKLNGCPWGSLSLQVAHLIKSNNVMTWLQENGCPQD